MALGPSHRLTTSTRIIFWTHVGQCLGLTTLPRSRAIPFRKSLFSESLQFIGNVDCRWLKYFTYSENLFISFLLLASSNCIILLLDRFSFFPLRTLYASFLFCFIMFFNFPSVLLMTFHSCHILLFNGFCKLFSSPFMLWRLFLRLNSFLCGLCYCCCYIFPLFLNFLLIYYIV
jgi:hypothetical protein